VSDGGGGRSRLGPEATGRVACGHGVGGGGGGTGAHEGGRERRRGGRHELGETAVGFRLSCIMTLVNVKILSLQPPRVTGYHV
jgi:hypothetical protein